MTSPNYWHLPIFCLLPFVLACSRERSECVVRIGDRKVTIEEFEQRARNMLKAGYRDLDTLKPEAKQKLLDGIIAQELLVKEGLERGLDRDSAIVEEVEHLKQKVLIDKLYQEKALKKEYAISEEELKRFWSEGGYDVEVLSQQIVCATEAEALEVLAALQRGERFEALAAKHSLPRIRQRFGDAGNIGWFKMADMLPPLREPMRTMEVGTVYPRPVKSALGYHVFRLNDRRPVPFETVRETLREQLRMQQIGRDRARYVQELRQQYAMEAHGEAIRRLLVLPGDRKYWEGEDEPLFTWKGGQFTIQDYLEKHRWGRAKHPASLDSAGLHKIADNLAGQRIMATEAHRLGYDRDPAIRAEWEKKRNELMARRLFASEGRAKAKEVSEEEVHSYYERHREQFTRADGKVTDLASVRDGIRRLLRQVAENQAMDRFIAQLREKYRSQIEIYPQALAKAFSPR